MIDRWQGGAQQLLVPATGQAISAGGSTTRTLGCVARHEKCTQCSRTLVFLYLAIFTRPPVTGIHGILYRKTAEPSDKAARTAL